MGQSRGLNKCCGQSRGLGQVCGQSRGLGQGCGQAKSQEFQSGGIGEGTTYRLPNATLYTPFIMIAA